MGTPQNSTRRYRQKARRTKQLAEWRARQPAKPAADAKAAKPAAVAKPAVAAKPAAGAAKK